MCFIKPSQNVLYFSRAVFFLSGKPFLGEQRLVLTNIAQDLERKMYHKRKKEGKSCITNVQHCADNQNFCFFGTNLIVTHVLVPFLHIKNKCDPGT